MQLHDQSFNERFSFHVLTYHAQTATMCIKQQTKQMNAHNFFLFCG